MVQLAAKQIQTTMPAYQQRGFTLIELMVVLVIIVLGTSIVAINFASGNDRAELKAAARDVVSALRYARGEALMDHEETTVDFDLESNSYTVSGREKTYGIPESIGLTIVTAESELTGQDQGSIRFYADGSSTGGRVNLTAGAAKWQIDINWLTGHISLNDASDDAEN